MERYSNIIYLDVDAVLTNPTVDFLSLLNERVGTNYAIKDVYTFEYAECLPKEHAEILLEMWKSSSLYDNREADQKALKALAEMRTFARVIALSGPVVGHVDSKLRWLIGHCGFLKKDTIIANDKSLVRGAVLIDDLIKNLTEFEGERICFAQPWNTKWDTKLGIRTDDWGEIVQKAREAIHKKLDSKPSTRRRK
ncbi:MAG: hypothetical protein PHV43_02225 [Candidatus Colwellbacteria bacterium]|nr:hypothetical protein [Candidatus Colwellbacteria bacterium]